MNTVCDVITMGSNIIRIGNSKGVIIPANLLEKLGLGLKASVDISLEDDRIVIRAEPRQGWEEAARKLHAEGADGLIVKDDFNDDFNDDFCREEWTW